MQTDTPEITIPDGLKPADGRFGSGPSKVRTEALEALAALGPEYMGTSHRRETVKSRVRRLRQAIVELYRLPDGYEVALGIGGATLFWDTAACCLIERRSQHLVFGEFGQKFAEAVAAAPHLDEPEVITAEPGSCPQARPADVDAYCYPHNETSTGVMAPVRRPGEGLVIVDGTSAAGALRLDPTDVDAYFFAPQKAFAADAGLWVAFLSPAAVERMSRLPDRWVPPILDLRVALENSRKDQTYNTPPLAALYLMADTAEWMVAQGGIEWAAGRCDRNAEVVYGWAERTPYTAPFVGDPALRSRAVATIDFSDEVDAARVAAVLRANGIVDVEPYRKLERNQLRIALFPAIETSDLEAFTACVDYVVERL